MGTPTPRPNRQALRDGIRVSWASVAWTLLASSVATTAGIVGGSLVLIVFGLTGLLDAAGSLTLALHFRHALANEHLSEARERIALRIVSGGLIVIGIGTIIESARRLTSGHPPNDSVLGAAVAACSIVALSALALRKRAVSPRIPSKALLADSWLSATGAGLAVIALAGTMFGTRENLSWVDPTCALIVALIAGAAGVGAMRSEESELTVE